MNSYIYLYNNFKSQNKKYPKDISALTYFESHLNMSFH